MMSIEAENAFSACVILQTKISSEGRFHDQFNVSREEWKLALNGKFKLFFVVVCHFVLEGRK